MSAWAKNRIQLTRCHLFVQPDPEEDGKINETRDVEFVWHNADAEPEDAEGDSSQTSADAAEATSTNHLQVCCQPAECPKEFLHCAHLQTYLK